MMGWSLFWWPFGMVFVGAWAIVSIVLLAFWIWMIVDCAKRNFKNQNEKIIWLIVVVLGGWIGALVYMIIIKNSNSVGISEQRSRKRR